MSSTTSFTDLFLPPQCYSKLVYMSPNEDTWVECASHRAYVTMNILGGILLIIALVIIYFWYQQKQNTDPNAPFPMGYMIVLGGIFLLGYFLYPPYATRYASVEYSGYQNEKRTFLRNNPNLTLSDYLRHKREEESTKNFGSVARAQNIMAAAWGIDVLSNLFGGRR